MKIKKIMCVYLSLVMLLSFASVVCASNVGALTSGNIKVVRFDSADKLHNKATTEDIVSDFDISFSLGSDGLQVQGNIENEDFSAVGVLATKNAKNTMLSYNAIDTDNNYNILYMSVCNETEKMVFTANLVSALDNYSNVVKLYMQEKNSGDYIMIEIYIEYDFVGSYISDNVVPHDEALASEMFSWFTKHIEAENGTEQINTYSTRQRRFQREYIYGNEVCYYNLVVDFVADIRNLSVNGSSTSSAYVEVIVSNVVYENGEEFLEDQMDLSVDNVCIKFSTIPNTVATRQEWIKEGNADFSGQLTFDVSTKEYTASQDLLGTSTLSTSNEYYSFGTTGTMGIRMTSTGYKNYSMRTVPVSMFAVGDKYGFDVTVKDKIGVAKTGKVIVAFQYDVVCLVDPANNFSDYFSISVTQTIN